MGRGLLLSDALYDCICYGIGLSGDTCVWCPAKDFNLHTIPLLVHLIIAVMTDSNEIIFGVAHAAISTFQSALQFRSSRPVQFISTGPRMPIEVGILLDM